MVWGRWRISTKSINIFLLFPKLNAAFFAVILFMLLMSINECNDFLLANVNVIARPSVCCLSVKFVRATQGIEIFGNVSTPFGTFATQWHSGKILRRSSQLNSSVGGVKH